MKITAVIPIRTGSQRVKDKNLRAFANTNLMELKIKNLLQVPELTSIVVNTNSEEAIRIVNESYGVTFRFRQKRQRKKKNHLKTRKSTSWHRRKRKGHCFICLNIV